MNQAYNIYKSPENYVMEGDQTIQSKKRSLSFIQAAELSWKLKSKADFVQYMDKHRKCHPYLSLTLLQYSTTCRQPRI